MNNSLKKISTLILSGSLVFTALGSSVAYADSDKHRYSRHDDRVYSQRDDRRYLRNDNRGKRDHYDRYASNDYGRYDRRDYRRYDGGHRYYYEPPRRTKHVTVVKHYDNYYRGHGYHHSDAEPYKWLAFTAITLKILDNLNENQQRAHEAAQARAVNAPIGETVYWNDAGARGSVTPVRDGYSSSGRYCREFQQEVVIGGRVESAYGTACRQPDGAWQVVSSGY